MSDKENKSHEDSKEIKITAGGQYIKDLSFENPLAPKIYTEKNVAPKITVSIDINVKKIHDSIFEVELVLSSRAIHDDREIFVIELTYAGIFTIKNVEDDSEELKEVLFIYCPSMLFPYARRIISDTTRDAAMPPLMLDTINFKVLYEDKKDSIKIGS